MPFSKAKSGHFWYLQTSNASLEELKSPECKSLAEEVESSNEAILRDIHSRIKEVSLTVSSIFGNKSKEHKYVSNMRLSSTPYGGTYSLRDLIERKQKELDVENNKLKEIKFKEDKNKKIEKAILFLSERGKKLTTDFTLDSALYTANEVKFQELVEESKKDGGPFNFNGQNCDDCDGWNGNDRRCNCGNRRVSWSYDGDFEDMYIYGEAY